MDKRAVWESCKSITIFIIFILFLLSDANHVNIFLLKDLIYECYTCY